MGILNPNPMKAKDGYDWYECQYCQYHVKDRYKNMFAQRAELQSSFLGKVKGKGICLKERLCQTGFHYSGMSSPACVAALNNMNL
uniref:Uncharacterized protein n=1 Tax=Hucho hucho TaxID=62062 RepID=A0A4W5RZI1_9TELE